MNLRIWTFMVFLLAGPGLAGAQSTITLDDFDLGSDDRKSAVQTPAKSASEMETCLVDPVKCKGSKFTAGKSFSVDDVVNLGIVDREEVKPVPAATGGAQPQSAQTLPSIDIEILFDYNEASIRSDQFGKLTELAGIIGRGDFTNFRFLFVGHTDAKGGALYNKDLSERRSNAVRAFLSGTGIAANRIAAIGRGAENLKSPDNPFGAENRRVQLVLIPLK